ncbi:patatin-like phospholipase family protein [Vibrio sonorensis]|uniref:patatin-like phospholipase family protein n=1 Tax=Vibrio sonorensis TaxID=1004316 RepID=UPI0008DAE5E2|nr:patatin-like phospholipase family protein [Vibrio sonorensis]
MPNNGIVTNDSHEIDLGRLSKYTGGKHSLVAQGGGQRGIFTAGVLDAFLLSNFDPFQEFYGTSAGALNLCAFLCRQRGIGRSFILELTTSKSFFNLFGYIRRKQYLGLDWALDRIRDYPYKLDLGMGRSVLGPRRAFAAVTNAATLHDHYFPAMGDDWQQVMLATCAIPRLYHREIELDEHLYIDGGVSASVPVQEAWRQGARLITVIRTEGLQIQPQNREVLIPAKEVEWFEESFKSINSQWRQKLMQWKTDWNDFFSEQIRRSKEQKKDHAHLDLINGGRWLFGADDIYRLSHLIGDKFDSGLADMLMVHYQTYQLTQGFLQNPPDDCFVVQIRPSAPLKSSSLLSDIDDLLHDYQLGLDAGYKYISLLEHPLNCHLHQQKHV